MELLYVWIEDYKNIKKQGFNFSPKHWFDFEYEEDKAGKVTGGTLKHEERNSDYPKGFFGKNISNVTAIVGKNGSGKSSLMEALLNFTLGSAPHMITSTPSINRKRGGFKTIIVYKDDNKKICYSGFSNIIGKINHIDSNGETIQFRIKIKKDFNIDDNDVSDPVKQFKRVNFIPSYLNILPCYYSNIFDEAKIIEYNDREDIVTVRTHEEHSNNTVRTDISINKRLDSTANIELFYFKEIEKQATFISQFLEKDEEFPFPLPPYLITILDFNQLKLEKYLKEEIVRANWLKMTINSTENFSLPTKISEQIILYLWLIGITELKITDSDKKTDLTTFIKKFDLTGKVNWSALFLEFKQKLNSMKAFTITHSPYSFSILDYFNGIEELISTKFLTRYDNRNGNKSHLVSYQLHDKAELEKMTEFMNCYEKISTTRLYKFGFSFEKKYIINTLSSGEKTLLKFGSNIWQLNTNIRENYSDKLSGEFKNSDLKVPEILLIMLDEAELNLHPEWQKTFLDWSLKIIKVVCKEFNSVQVLYSSHSPFFLSDLPKENVIFLKTKDGKDDKGNKINQCHVCSREEQPDQTFGANIHSLYRNSFFLENGLMGEFAKGKIDEVIKDLNLPKEKIREERQKEMKFIIEQIGEPLIKDKLLQKYKVRFEPIEDQINELRLKIKKLEASRKN